MLDLHTRTVEICKTLHDNYNKTLSERIYKYINNQWFCPSTPILHNFGKKHGLPISCFVNHVGDSMDSIRKSYDEAFEYARYGGGVGTYWGEIRELGSSIRGENNQHRGVIPFLKIQDSMAVAVNQTNVRSGSTAVYMDIWHPEIETFIELRRVSGDPNRKCLNLHHGVIIDDEFMKSVIENKYYTLKSPLNNENVSSVNARELWEKILTTRIETGEPFIIFIDNVNNTLPPLNGDNTKVYTSNLCSEILQPTNENNPAVCCLASLNLEKWLEFESILNDVVKDILLFLDYVLEEFLDKTKSNPIFNNTANSVRNNRAIGLGVMGFHSFLQSLNVPFDSVMSKAWNNKIFNNIHKACNEANKELGSEFGFCLSTKDTSYPRRFSFTQSVAPTATISGHFNTSPSIEPYISNIFVEKTQKGNKVIKNKYLEKLLVSKVGETETKKEFKKIQSNGGCVFECKVLEDHEKDIFKTAFDIDQRWIIDLAGDRAKFIDQGQSVNLFFESNVKKSYLNKVHIDAWKKGVKSLYYCRSKSEKRAQVVGQENYKECLACQ